MVKLSHCTKMKFSIKNFFIKFVADLVTFTEKILHGKLDFLCDVSSKNEYFKCGLVACFF